MSVSRPSQTRCNSGSGAIALPLERSKCPPNQGNSGDEEGDTDDDVRLTVYDAAERTRDGRQDAGSPGEGPHAPVPCAPTARDETKNAYDTHESEQNRQYLKRTHSLAPLRRRKHPVPSHTARNSIQHTGTCNSVKSDCPQESTGVY